MRLIRTTVKGKPAWAEQAPEACFEGHTELRPGSGCPECGVRRVRKWTCDVCGEVLVDPDHVHRDGPLPPSALRGA